MPNQVLQSLGILNQFLAQEVATAKEEKREDLINEAGLQISQDFAAVGPDATPQDIMGIATKAYGSAATKGVLQQSMPLINSMTQTSLMKSQMAKEEREQRGFTDYVDSITRTDMGNVPAQFLGAALDIQRGLTTEIQTTDEDGRASINKYLYSAETGKDELIQSFSYGPTQQEQQESALAYREQELKMQAAKEMTVDNNRFQNSLNLALQKGEMEMARDLINKGAEGTFSNIKTSDYENAYQLFRDDNMAKASSLIYTMRNKVGEGKMEDLGIIFGSGDEILGDPREALATALRRPDLMQAFIDEDEFGTAKAATFPGARFQDEAGNIMSHTFVPENLETEFNDFMLNYEATEQVKSQFGRGFLDPSVLPQKPATIPAEVMQGDLDIYETAINDENYPSSRKAIFERTLRMIMNRQVDVAPNPESLKGLWDTATKDEKEQFALFTRGLK